MIWVFFVVVALGVIGYVAALVMSRVRFDPLSEPVHTTPDVFVPRPDSPPSDHGTVRFDTALRGYRMDQVDDVIDALEDRLARTEAELEALRERERADDHDE